VVCSVESGCFRPITPGVLRRNYPLGLAVSGYMKLLAIALSVLAPSASFGQPAHEGRRGTPERHGGHGIEVPRAWGPAIAPELRSRSTRDVPMGGGKPTKDHPPIGAGNHDDRHTRPF